MHAAYAEHDRSPYVAYIAMVIIRHEKRETGNLVSVLWQVLTMPIWLPKRLVVRMPRRAEILLRLLRCAASQMDTSIQHLQGLGSVGSPKRNIILFFNHARSGSTGREEMASKVLWGADRGCGCVCHRCELFTALSSLDMHTWRYAVSRRGVRQYLIQK